jgi:uncharacterized protein DUF4474
MEHDWQPSSSLAQIVYAAGFKYDPDQDIIYSRMKAWQRTFGYGYPYDLAAPATISAIIDCEPVFFRYDDKNWMIELWKGQYGLETGAEIGVYVSREDRKFLDATLGKRPHDPQNSRFFDCVKDNERLEMSFVLFRKGVEIFRRGPKVHWWLTGFKWGVLSEPEDLTMTANITFPSQGMCSAFVTALQATGYAPTVTGGISVSFEFKTPFTEQPRSDPNCKQFVDAAINANSEIVARYQALNLQSNDPNKIPDVFAQYFKTHNTGFFVRNLFRVLKAGNTTRNDIAKALKDFNDTNYPRWKEVADNLIDFMKKLFR